MNLKERKSAELLLEETIVLNREVKSTLKLNLNTDRVLSHKGIVYSNKKKNLFDLFMATKI